MMKKIFLLVIILGLLIFLLYPKNDHNTTTIPKITLKGKSVITLSLGETYKEDGYLAMNGKKNITDKVKVNSNIDYNKPGIYQITYEVKSNDLKAETFRFIKINDKPSYKANYDKIDNTSNGWWSGNKFNYTRPSGGANINELKKYNAFFLGDDEKVIYLTFDEGANDTYVKEIVEVLNENEVKGTFFLCERYILSHADLVRHMVNTGHLIGNHTSNHKNMPSLANKNTFDEYLNEVKSVEIAYKKVTGKEMEKVYRDPRGEWSYRDLQIMKDLGYRTYFYSANYLDWEGDTSLEYTLKELMKRYHNGAIYLLHPVNKGNYLALGPFIKEMKKLGFKFDIVSNIK